MTADLQRVAWFGTPVLMTALLHGVVLLALLWQWTDTRTVEARKARPAVLVATLVNANTLAAKSEPTVRSNSDTKQRSPAPVNPSSRGLHQGTPIPKPKPIPEVEPSSSAEPPVRSVNEAKREPPSIGGELAAQVLSDINGVIDTDNQNQDAAGLSLSDTVAATIQLSVINRWARPPSARNGMQAILEIALVPTGDIAGVTVISSSGNSAFDRSAISAVERAGRFPEVQQLEAAVFERDFRRFQLIFRPEDLRY